MAEKLTPKDVQYKTAVLNGKTYSYILAEPQGKCLNTIFLVHGWPDMAFGWRYQIPFLTSLGLRVVAPDMMGYSGTDAPDSPEFYTYKRAADDLAALAKELGLSSIILGGHDWGGAVVYRVALRYPKLISAFFSVCTPYFPPRKEYFPISALPNFKYQVQLASGEVEKHIVGEEKLGQLLNGMYGGRTPSGETTFDVAVGVVYDNLPEVGPSPLLSKEEIDFYVKRYAIHGIHGPLNWYRTSELNFNDEIELAEKSVEDLKFQMPALFIGGTKDQALPPSLAAGMEKSFRSLTKGEVNASHWALWEKPAEVNQYLKEFLFGQVGLAKASL
ncbi:Bifunctional epoxide hydrolase [Lachnellula hyalina]|uniref:Bifunctional epoxide hydrolase n=1 Tax=Lachnellula hyalina TaxID=1316788 RepID=A0A8H8R693_9HELO|nr:Bifunctional epoxide hydrolase [Lachnellula hyalina]TVY28490.1 Bifunctional epoxide hydrolase [Lachnellula hyalina]